MSKRSETVLVWGIAGASLGMEIAKCLALAGYKNIVGCDISKLAFGHFSPIFHSTHILQRDAIEESLQQMLSIVRPQFVIAGGDQVARIISSHSGLFAEHDCRICGNAQDVVELATDKFLVMKRLEEAGFVIPDTRLLENEDSIQGLPLPAVLKPQFDSGGSRGVFVVTALAELQTRIKAILAGQTQYIVQEYVTDSEGEYTIGVLSGTDGTVAGSVLLRRTFQNMLSVHERTDNFLISSGSSQGVFERHEELQSQAEKMAAAVGSLGPLNIQARVRAGRLAPFEINPRFSASTYLRALAGVNEVDLFVQHLVSGAPIEYPVWKEGLALRTFGEVFVEKNSLPSDVL